MEDVEGDSQEAVEVSEKGKRILTLRPYGAKILSIDVHTPQFATKAGARIGSRFGTLVKLYGGKGEAFAEEIGTIARFKSLPGVTFNLAHDQNLVGAANLWKKLLAANVVVESISVTKPKVAGLR